MQELETYVGTTSRHGQRIVNAIAAENPEWVLFSFDVSQAFAKGMTFAELSALTGLEMREVQFDIPAKDIEILQMIDGFELQTLHPVPSPIHSLRCENSA